MSRGIPKIWISLCPHYLHDYAHIKFSTPNESPHKITAPTKAAAAKVEEDTEFPNELYEVFEMVTSSAKTRYAPAVKLPPMESKACKNSAAHDENQEACVNFD